MKALFGKFILAASLLAFSGITTADEVRDSLIALAKSEVQSWLNTPAVWEQVKAQNSKHQGMSETDILSLDKQWRAETSSSSRPLIDKVLSTSLSSYLSDVKQKSGGVYTEIFVMDSIGLNVGQSDVTSDYWQGDEAKWQKTYPMGPEAYHIGDVEMDESSQQLQVQLRPAGC